MKRIILCADDFGQNNDISRGVLQLVKAQRLSAVSCLTTFPAWEEHAKDLLSSSEQIDIGLHFNLTEGVSKISDISKLIFNAYLRRLDKQQVYNEFAKQLAAFIKYAGKLPDFIDGHQHIQHLPIIRDVIFDWYKQLETKTLPYIRISYSSFGNLLKQTWSLPKALVIGLTGGMSFKRRVKQLHIPHNSSFAGVYAFRKAKRYPQIFHNILQVVSDGTLVMCHPGLESNDVSDFLVDSRKDELEYFLSGLFLEDCEKSGVGLGRFV